MRWLSAQFKFPERYVARDDGRSVFHVRFIPSSLTLAVPHLQCHTQSRLPALPDSLELPSSFKDAAESFMATSSGTETETVTSAVSNAESAMSLGEAGPVIGIVAAIALAGVAAMSASGDKKEGTAPKAAEPEPEPEPIDVSIPYDAAAVLAYKALKSIEEVEDAGEFAKFKASYEAYTVAEVAFKKASRDFESFKATLGEA